MPPQFSSWTDHKEPSNIDEKIIDRQKYKYFFILFNFGDKLNKKILLLKKKKEIQVT